MTLRDDWTLMKKPYLAGILLACCSLAACGGTTALPTGAKAVATSAVARSAVAAASSAAPTTSESTDTPTPTPTPTSTTAKLGQSFTYTDGLVITVGAPAAYTPSKYADVTPAAAFVSFQVTIMNGTPNNYEPSDASATVQSGTSESDEIFDSANGMNGSPDTTLLPTRSVVYTVAFGVANPADLVFQFTPGFDYDASIFTS